MVIKPYDEQEMVFGGPGKEITGYGWWSIYHFLQEFMFEYQMFNTILSFHCWSLSNMKNFREIFLPMTILSNHYFNQKFFTPEMVFWKVERNGLVESSSLDPWILSFWVRMYPESLPSFGATSKRWLITTNLLIKYNLSTTFWLIYFWDKFLKAG